MKQELLGSVFEFLSLESARKGKYQETRFLALRKDIKPEQCLYTQEEQEYEF